VKLPLQKSSFSSATAPEILDGDELMMIITGQLGTPRGRCDEHSSKFSLSKKPWYVKSRKKPVLQKVILASLVTL
jgi:hypothetical protein